MFRYPPYAVQLQSPVAMSMLKERRPTHNILKTNRLIFFQKAYYARFITELFTDLQLLLSRLYPDGQALCPPAVRSCPPNKYRSLDGSCNNVRHPERGTRGSPFRRLLLPSYSDGELSWAEHTDDGGSKNLWSLGQYLPAHTLNIPQDRHLKQTSVEVARGCTLLATNIADVCRDCLRRNSPGRRTDNIYPISIFVWFMLWRFVKSRCVTTQQTGPMCTSVSTLAVYKCSHVLFDLLNSRA